VPALQGPLRTTGVRVVDGTGQPIVLRGIQRVGFQIPGKWPAITASEMDHAQAWGANVIRLPLAEASIDPGCPKQYDPTYLDDLDNAVQLITSRGMVALLDLSFTTRVRCGDSDRWRMADSPGSLQFWNVIASRYKSNPLAAFDLFNEPHDITDQEWQHGGQMADWTATGSVRWTAAGMQQLYDTVRATGATNLITITGNGWGANPSPIITGHGIVGVNLVYAAHAYTCSEPKGAQWCTANPQNQQQQINPQWTRVATHRPVMITEFGWPDPNDGGYNASVIQFAQAQNPPWGWIAFAWDGTNKSEFGLVADLTTYAPTPSGAPVRAALGSLP
jgi:endoglucanase